jgi:hypothetical protein
MHKNFSFQIPGQIPEYIADSGPLMSEFLRLYYSYTESRKNATGLIRYHPENNDVDNSLSEYIDRFYNIRAAKFPNKPKLGKPQLIKLLNDIYDAKGTEKSYKLLFRVLFGEEIAIYQPADAILRASDGRWKQPSFITVKRTIQTNESYPVTPFLLNVETGTGNKFNVDIYDVELIDETSTEKTFRYYFKQNQYVPFEAHNWLYVNVGEYIFTVSLIKSYTKLFIVTPGKSWRVGQVFSIPHDSILTGSSGLHLYKNTIARVKSIDSNGGILAAEVLEYGWPHNVNKSALVSPYPASSRPPGAVTDIYTNVISNPDDSLTYEHVVNISDNLDLHEYVTGLMYQNYNNPNSYFSEDYIEASGGYLGDRVFAVLSTPETTIVSDPSLSLTDWLNARASVTLLPEFVSKSRGSYSGDNGKLSNQNIRLQDSYYYQLFSYVIETTVDINDYREAIGELHPAGLKRFSKLNAIAKIKLDYAIDRTISTERIDLLDIVDINSDTPEFNFTKVVNDDVSITDTVSMNVNKYISDSVALSDGSYSVDIGAYFDTDYVSEKYTMNEIAINID